jgi:hypothetical protein
MDHNAAPAGPLPTEPGQGAFAALTEIVSMLRLDPQTDWTKVNITALREHLVDMDRLVSDLTVSTRAVPDGLEMTIPVTGPGGSAASRMVPAHGPVVEAETGWSSSLTRSGNNLIWTVTSAEHSPVIRALGFFGLMATGDHHREHHLAMATGRLSH